MSREYEKGLISVIVPTYNRAELLPAALNSVWNQTYRPIELIVVDDGSDDDTYAVAKQWMTRRASDSDFAVQLLRQRNRGAGAARNHGLIASRGECIQYLDSDDVLHPSKLTNHINELRNAEAGFVWSPMLEIARKALLQDAFPTIEESSDVWFQSDDGLPTSACAGMYRRGVCYRIGPWAEDLVCKEDWDYSYRLKCLDPKTSYVSVPQYAASVHRGGRVNDHFQTEEGVASLLEVIRRGERYRQAVPSADISLRNHYLEALRLVLHHEHLGFGKQLLELVQTSPELQEDYHKFYIILCAKSLIGASVVSTLFDWYSFAKLTINNRL
jgi:glycosyltransferase involved in cell wall biosynthesis